MGDLSTRIHPDLREAKAQIENLLEQIHQMQGMFDDGDGTIQAAIDDAEAWLDKTQPEKSNEPTNVPR